MLSAPDERLASVFDSISDACLLLDNDQCISCLNEAARQLLQKNDSEVIGQRLLDAFPEPLSAAFKEKCAPALEEENATSFEVLINSLSHVDWYEVRVYPSVDGFFLCFHVITERKKIEEDLQESSEWFRSAFDGTNDSIFITGTDGRIIDANEVASTCIGYSKDELRSMWLSDLCRVESISNIRSRFQRLDVGEVVTSEAEISKKDGTTVDVELISKRIVIGDNSYITTIARDMRGQKKAEKELRESKIRFRELADLLPQSIFETDEHGRVTCANRAGFEVFGYDDADLQQGVNFISVIAPRDRDLALKNMQRRLAGEVIPRAEYMAQRKDGSTFPIALYASAIMQGNKPTGIRGIVVDLTESRLLEQETLRAQKIESIGVLAAGIAHDFNNLLGIIMGNISLASVYQRSERDHSHLLVQAEKACLQAKGLTEELLNLAKGGDPYKQTVSLREILSEAVDLTTDTSNVRCHFEIQEDLWPIWCDPSQVRQVIVNLLANASEAMPGGGTVQFEAWNEDIQDTTSLLRAGRYVKLSVKDYGVGIPEGDKPKVFDPYFSTKTRGTQKGMGLGLSLAYWVIRRHGGHIEMESATGEGTKFNIVLPAAEIREPQIPHAVGQTIHRLG